MRKRKSLKLSLILSIIKLQALVEGFSIRPSLLLYFFVNRFCLFSLGPGCGFLCLGGVLSSHLWLLSFIEAGSSPSFSFLSFFSAMKTYLPCKKKKYAAPDISLLDRTSKSDRAFVFSFWAIGSSGATKRSFAFVAYQMLNGFFSWGWHNTTSIHNFLALALPVA